MYSSHQSKPSPRPIQRNLLVDGYIAYTLQPPAATIYLSRLLPNSTADRLEPIFNQRSILIRRTMLYHDFRETHDSQGLVLLDYLVDPTIGTVVPQKLPSVASSGARQMLQAPFFFTQSDGSLGIALSEALSLDESSPLNQRGSESNDAVLVLSWPGYPEYARTQAGWNTRSGNGANRQLSQRVAYFLASFFENPPAKPGRNDDETAQWAVGPSWKDHIMLVGLLQVSSTPNVWMPIIQLHGLFRTY
ncbi:hypothetical protein PENSPDRAFT_247599 [Peniophora sp. CONT]|nr:hypothetical protein PENSPDRAFT_247599 [Peniophora sp. CONT]